MVLFGPEPRERAFADLGGDPTDDGSGILPGDCS